MSSQPYFDESFWTSVSETYTPSSTRREVEFLLDTTSRERPGSILDMGCGEGRHATLLAQMGWVVVGVDNYLAALRRGRDANRGLKVRFIDGDMRQLPLRNNARFDVVAFFQNTFGYFSDIQNFALLTDAASRLVQGGWIYLDCANGDAEEGVALRSYARIHGSVRYLYVETYDYPTSRLRIEVRTDGPEGVGPSRSAEFRVFRPAEVGTLLRLAGFEDVRLYGDFRSTGPVAASDRYVQVVGRKP